MIFEGETQANAEIPLSDLFDSADPTDVRSWKRVIHANAPTHRDINYTKRGRMALDATHPWPWHHRPNFGLGPSKPGVTRSAAKSKFHDWIDEKIWDRFNEQLGMKLLRRLEKRTGWLRGHVIIEFQASARAYTQGYECDTCGNEHWFLERALAGGDAVGRDCPDPVCAGQFIEDVAKPVQPAWDTLPISSIGFPLGVSLLASDDAGLHCTWAHEIGHNRHFEHAGKEGGAQVDQHDSRPNNTAPWGGLGGLVATHGLSNVAANKQWDHLCVMTYNDYVRQYFCAKCILRNRGWKITALGDPPAGTVGP
jgi:hypothetical protein